MIEFAPVFLFALMAAMIPGSDFIVISRYALEGSRKTALLASAGIALGLSVHCTAASCGIALLLENSPFLFQIIQLAGACYLAYLGFQLFRFSAALPAAASPELGQQAIVTGFLTNLLNPKATVFILSFFSQLQVEELHLRLFYAAIIVAVTFGWFAFVSLLITKSRFRPLFDRFRSTLMKCAGVFLLLFSSAAFVHSLILFRNVS